MFDDFDTQIQVDEKYASKEDVHLAFMMMGMASAIWDDLSPEEKQELEDIRKQLET